MKWPSRRLGLLVEEGRRRRKSPGKQWLTTTAGEATGGKMIPVFPKPRVYSRDALNLLVPSVFLLLQHVRRCRILWRADGR